MILHTLAFTNSIAAVVEALWYVATIVRNLVACSLVITRIIEAVDERRFIVPIGGIGARICPITRALDKGDVSSNKRGFVARALLKA